MGLCTGLPAAVRAGRAALLLGLVVLIAAHLAGTVHGPVFTGAHAGAGVSARAHSATGGSGPLPEHGHGHGHERDQNHEHDHEHSHGHVDHAVDRPRALAQPHALTAQSPDASGLSPSWSRLPAADARQSVPTGMAPEGSRGGPRAPDGRSALALHCVWRQ